MKRIVVFLFVFLALWNQVFAYENYYLFWLRLQDNEYELVPKIENKFGVKIPLVSVIYDDFAEWESYKLSKTFKTLGSNIVYHISINPFGYTLRELVDDKEHKWWEQKYKKLFRIIKKNNVKVIFRSLHEMNGWWYSRSSDPYRFQIFWKMMWDWSREEWLDKSNILFDFSVNSQDLPVVDGYSVSQWAPLVNCNQETKKKTGCFTFEDYYPWDDYVDIVGVTIYNWWKWARKESWATWRSPMTVINEPGYKTFDRMKKLWKPIFIDEAGSTSINIEGSYNELKLIDIYKQNHSSMGTGTLVKNNWISQLQKIYTDPQVIGWAYFNADVTNWLSDRRQIGELDWTAIDPDKNFVYPAIINLLNNPKNSHNPLLLFDLPKDILDNREWITDEEMYELHDLVSKILVYKEWDLITSGNYKWNLKYPKYQFYLEELLQKDPIICDFIKNKFEKIQCNDIELIENYEEKKEILNNVLKIVLNSDIKLSNWWIWDRIEKYKTILSYKSRNFEPDTDKYNKYISTMNYLDSYEKNFLDLR